MRNYFYKFLVLFSILFIYNSSFLISNSVAQWTQTNGPIAGDVSCFFSAGNSIVCAPKNNGLYFSTDNGLSWNKDNSNFPNYSSVNDFARNSQNIFAATISNKIQRSSNNGVSWISNTSIPGQNITSIYANDTVLLAGVYNSGLYKSTNNGNNWLQFTGGLPANVSVNSIIIDAGVLFACMGDMNLYKSTNNGINWIIINYGIPRQVNAVSRFDGNLFLATISGVLKSTNDGIDWSDFNGGLSFNTNVKKFSIYNNKLYIITNSGIYFIQQGSTLWSPLNNGLLDLETNSFFAFNNYFFTGTASNGVYRSSNFGSLWEYCNTGKIFSAVYSLTKNNNEIIATGWYSSSGNGFGISKTSNFGLTWEYINNGLPIGTLIWTVEIDGGNMYCGLNVLPGGVYRSTNSGQYWYRITDSNGYFDTYQIAVSGPHIFFGTDNYIYLHYSSDYGNTWIDFPNGPYWQPSGLLFKDQYLFESTYRDSICRTSNYGASWEYISINRRHVYTDFYVYNNKIYVGTDGGVYYTTNNGNNWVRTNNGFGSDSLIFSIAVQSPFIFAGTNKGLYFSSDEGLSWSKRNEAFPDTSRIYCLTISNNYLFAGTQRGVWKRPLSDYIGIKTISSIVPEYFSLYQNYPNPFNPSTNIKYQISLPGGSSTNNKLVTLKIFDILGKERATLVNEKQAPGTYEVTFDGKDLSSGIYFYKISAGDFNDTKRMILIK